MIVKNTNVGFFHYIPWRIEPARGESRKTLRTALPPAYGRPWA